MRKFASWRRCSQDTPHLADQLSPSILDNLRGTTEFGLYWILRALNGLATNGALEVKRLHLVSKCVEAELENLRRPKDNLSTLTHKQITEKYAQNCDYIKNILQIVDRIRKLLSCCPKEHYKQTSHDLGNLQEPLGILRQSDLQFSQLNKNVDDLLCIITKLCKLNENEKEFILHLPIIFEEESNILEEDIWNKTRLSTYSQNFSLLLEDLKSIVMTNNIQHYFPEDSRRICEIIDKISSFNECENVISQSTHNQSHFNENSFDELQHLLLFRLQNIFNQMESLLNSDSMNRFDAIKSLIEYFGQNTFKASNQLIRNFHIIFLSSSIQSDTSIDLLNKFSTLAIGVHKLYERLLHYLCEFIFNSISLHEHWVAIGCHLLTNGFVNPIPKSGPSLQGDDKRVENMCGFGDGDLTNDAKDVGGELEAMEQIEGLKNGTENNLNDNQDVDQSNENPSDEQQKLPEVDNPIDVDDDFAGCIEGLDAQDGEDEENGDDNNCEEDPNADWNFGEVDEPEERQLDPKLWERNESDENEQEMEEDDNVGNGADSLTEDLVAAQQQKQQKSDENQEKGAKSSDTYQSEDENVDDYDATEPDEKGERRDENENNASDAEQSIDKDVEDLELTQENDDTEEKDDNEKRNGEEYLSEDEDNQKQNEKQEDKNGEGNSGEMEKEKDEDLYDEYQNNEAFNNEFEQDAIGDNEGTPNASRPPGIIDKEQEEKNDARTQGEDKNSNDQDVDGEQNQRESAARNPTKSAQLETDSQQNEQLNEVEPSRDNCNSGNERGGDNSVDEEMEENAFDEVEQEKLSVTGTSTLEQANRTRALFDISLRRLRKEVKTNELAENASDQQNLNKEKQNDEADGEIEMDNEDNASIEIIDDSSAKEMSNVFLNITERQNFNFGINSNELISMDNLCKEFDRLERETPTTSNEEDIRQLQLKWALISESVTSLASELAESLRSIIEPTVASKLQGDYRTGKRLNMRRLIAYIASDYRKDQIWMRRTKCAKRNYQVCIAVDNSQSMKHNHFTEITCNALCLIERALRQLEIGQLSICSFGSNVHMLSDFQSVEDPSLGLHILQTFKFNQQRTDISQLLESSITLFKSGRECSMQIPEQMLIILGDGRDVLANGIADIKKHLEHLEHDRVTVLFLIMDIAEQSITEVRIADFADGGCSFRPYMECFPFPLYALVRSANSLPSTIAEAIHQWFEYTRNE
uniref:VWFA domain-containing protein n=1 Tax=Meloidogyne enterolobii TaxID=390850 RepID=A0A6V7V1S2_MELEN|nr:unnamed protein product [Meloidogyne enterolobii]